MQYKIDTTSIILINTNAIKSNLATQELHRVPKRLHVWFMLSGLAPNSWERKACAYFLVVKIVLEFRMLQNEMGWSWKQLCICSSWSCQTTDTNAIKVMDLDRWEHKSAGIAIFMFSMVVLSRHPSESSKGFDSPNTSSSAETKEI